MKKFWLKILNFVDKKPVMLIFLLSFAYAFCAMTFAREVLAPRMNWQAVNGDLAGDPQEYQRIAHYKNQEMKANGLHAFELRPEMSGAAGVASLIYFVGGGIYSVVILNALLHGLSVVLMVLTLKFWFNNRIALFAALPMMISPYLMVWFSQINKDSYTITGSLLLLYGTMKLVEGASSEKSSIKGYIINTLIAVAGVLLVGLVRLYLNQIYFLAFIVTYFLALVFNGSRQFKQFTVSFAVVCVVFRLMSFENDTDFSVNQYIKATEQPPVSQNVGLPPVTQNVGSKSNEKVIEADSVQQCFANVSAVKWNNDFPSDYVNKNSRSLMAQRCLIFNLIKEQRNEASINSVVDLTFLPSSTSDTLKYIPRAFIYGSFSPWPEKWFYIVGHKASAFYVIAPIEAFFVYMGLMFIFLWALKTRDWKALVPFIFVSITCTIYGMSIPFIGALYRYRYIWWMFLLCFGIAAGFTVIKEKISSGRRTI